MITRTAIFLSAALVAVGIPAQQDGPVSVARTSTGFVLEEGEYAIKDLVEKAARFLGRNILVQQMEMDAANPAPIEITKRIELDAQGCEELLSSLLYTRFFVVVPLDEEKGFYEVISIQGQRRTEVMSRATSRTSEEIFMRPTLYEAVITTVRLEHINAQHATNSLRPFFAQAGGGSYPQLIVGSAGNSDSILLQGFRPQVAAALRLIEKVDQPSRDELPKVREEIATLKQRLESLERKLK